mmetsp:Transcript_83488/g.135351  ORF Transcript_83488/g.135351 Transcript_83488/m.135351 type:complete len:204 (+) Transcript_83488:143-754(+)
MGIPLKSTYPEGMSVTVLYFVFNTIFLLIGLAVAHAIYTYGSTSEYSAKISLLASNSLGWMYMGLVVMKVGLLLINVQLGIARKESKVNVPDQQVYKAHGSDIKGYILMETEGTLGRFNRAQRAFQNYLEGSPMTIVMFVFASFVFPFPTFVCISLFCVAKVVACHGYISHPEGRMGDNISSENIIFGQKSWTNVQKVGADGL